MGDVRQMRVPIVGDKKALIHQVMVSVVASCACGGTVPIVLGSVAAVVACQACGDEYYLAKLGVSATEAGAGMVEISLGRVAKASAVSPN